MRAVRGAPPVTVATLCVCLLSSDTQESSVHTPNTSAPTCSKRRGALQIPQNESAGPKGWLQFVQKMALIDTTGAGAGTGTGAGAGAGAGAGDGDGGSMGAGAGAVSGSASGAGAAGAAAA